MKVLVLGGYGLIGGEIVRQLLGRGIQVVGLARSSVRGRRLFPQADWIGADLSGLTKPEDWTACLADVDAVVNAAGALQSGGAGRSRRRPAARLHGRLSHSLRQPSASRHDGRDTRDDSEIA